MRKFKYTYYVVYMSENNIYGCCNISRKYKIDTPSEIKSVTDFISNEYCAGRKVIIMNFILLNSRGVDE